MKNKIVAITATTLLVIPNFSKPAQANPAALPILGACSNPATCIVAGTIVIGTVVYILLKSSDGRYYKGKKIKQLTPSVVHVEGNGSKPYPVGHELPITDPVLNQKECDKVAQDYTNQGHGEWVALPVQRIGEINTNVDEYGRIGTPEFTPLYQCTIKRVR